MEVTSLETAHSVHAQTMNLSVETPNAFARTTCVMEKMIVSIQESLVHPSLSLSPSLIIYLIIKLIKFLTFFGHFLHTGGIFSFDTII